MISDIRVLGYVKIENANSIWYVHKIAISHKSICRILFPHIRFILCTNSVNSICRFTIGAMLHIHLTVVNSYGQLREGRRTAIVTTLFQMYVEEIAAVWVGRFVNFSGFCFSICSSHSTLLGKDKFSSCNKQ